MATWQGGESMTIFSRRHRFLSLIFLLAASTLAGMEYLRRDMDWKIYADNCRGEFRKTKAGYEVEKLTRESGGPGVYFFNDRGIPVQPGKWYRVSLELAQCDATVEPWLRVYFDTPNRKPGQYMTQILNQKAALEFQAQPEDAEVRTSLLVCGDGRAVVRSIDVREIAAPSRDASRSTPNLLGQGSGFEVGSHGMNAFHAQSWWFGWIEPAIQPVFDDQVFYDGAFSLKLTAQDYSSVAMHETHNTVWFCPVKLDPEKEYTLSAWLKADRNGLPVNFSLGEYQTKSTQFKVTTEWKRYSFTCRPDQVRLENYCRATIALPHSVLAGILWIDNVQLEEGSTAGDYQPEPIEFGAALEMDDDKLVCKQDLADCFITARFRNNTDTTAKANVEYVIRDYWDRIRASGTVSAVVPADGNVVRSVPIPALPCGYYRARFQDRSGRLYDEVIFGIYEPMEYRGKLPRDWPLGCHDTVALPILRELGFGWIRAFHDFSMKKIVPEKDVCSFENADIVVKKCEAANLNLMPILGPDFFCNDLIYGSIPKWAVAERTRDEHASGGGERAAFPDMAAWRKYVRELARRYKGRVAAWEVFNEPDGWGIRPEKYLSYLQAAYEEAKKEDPACWIIGGSTTSDFGKIPLPWTRSFMKQDHYTHFDAISVHMYSNQMPERTLNGTENFLGFLRNELIRNGRDIPVWHTEKSHSIMELGYSRRKFNLPPSYNKTPGYRVNSFRDRAEYLLRESIIDSCVGKGPFFWYAEITSKTYIAQKVISGYDPYWLWHTEYDGSPFPELLAANGLARMLENRSTPKELIKLSDSVYCGLYEGPAGALAALWNIKGPTKLRLDSAAETFRLFDFFGEPMERLPSGEIELNTAPVYLQGDNFNADEMKQLLLNSRLAGSPPQLSGGLEKKGNQLFLVAYIDNGGVGGEELALSILSAPAGWNVEKHHRTVSTRYRTTRIALPVYSFRAADETQSFTLELNGKVRETISILPFATDEFFSEAVAHAAAVRSRIPKKIDGRLDDWEAAAGVRAALPELVKYGREDWKDMADLSCEGRFSYDEKNLYAAFLVHDDVVERFAAPDAGYMSDGIELFLGLDPDAPEHKPAEFAALSTTDFQIFLAPGTPLGKYRQATAAIAGRRECSIEVASAVTSSGYVLEAAIPWKSLVPGYLPQPGCKLLMSFQVTDTDIPNVPTSKKIFWTGDESNYNSPLNWGTLVLR